MKFRNIKQFTKANYAVDVSITDLEHMLTRYITEFGLELNPDFQRGHVWNLKQQREYIEYVLQGGTSGRDIYFNHPGWMNSFEGDMVCVDGLQRLTAITKFFNGELTIFGGAYLSDFDDKVGFTNSVRFHVNDLQTKNEVYQWYINMNSGGTDHTDEEIQKVKNLITS